MRTLLQKFIPKKILNIYYWALEFLAALVYGFPSKKLYVIGVTGTNGKTTVVELIAHILEKADFKVASISSVQFKIGSKTWTNKLKMTMPSRLRLQGFFKKALGASCQYVVLETTSEGIKQYRHQFVDYNAAVFTNLTPEHIESHGSFEKYRKAKGQLFKKLKNQKLKVKTKTQNPKLKKIAIVNLDDESAEYFLQFPADEKWGYSLEAKDKKQKAKSLNCLLQVSDYKLLKNSLKFQISGLKFQVPLIGKFNIYNSLAAICLGLSQGIALKTIQKALENFPGIPGRMEFIKKGQDFTVVVDYAHTPDALQKVYNTLSGNFKPLAPNSRMIGVLGAAGGGRDKWKRPILGRIAAQFCDIVIVTNEDPYDEDPWQIIEEIARGAFSITQSANQPMTKKIIKILDRKKAIRYALSLAQKNDIVIITGKGAEPWMCIGKEKIPWDDRKVIKSALAQPKLKQ